jgi:hypothetical protein
MRDDFVGQGPANYPSLVFYICVVTTFTKTASVRTQSSLLREV